MGLEPPSRESSLIVRFGSNPLPVGGARDCWPPPELVGVEVVEVVVVAEVGNDVVPPVEDRDEDEDDDHDAHNAHDAHNPLPLCLGRPPASQQTTPPRTLNQADLQRRLRMLLQDQEQLAQGREIANVTMTNSIVTSYKQGGRPSVQSTSSRYSS